MLRRRLSLLNACDLYRCAARDVRQDRFRKKEFLDDAHNVVDYCYVSDHMNLLLQQFKSDQAHQLRYHPVLYWTSACFAHLRLYHVRSFSAAMDILNEESSNFQQRIQSAYAANKSAVAHLEGIHDTYAEDEAIHYMVHYKKQALLLEQKFNKRAIRLYKVAIALLNRKLRILYGMRNRIERMMAKTFLQVRTYYAYATRMDGKLPVQYLSDAHLYAIGSLSTIFPYEQEILLTQKLLNEYLTDLSRLTQ